jgi:hypothetical protein
MRPTVIRRSFIGAGVAEFAEFVKGEVDTNGALARAAGIAAQ